MKRLGVVAVAVVLAACRSENSTSPYLSAEQESRSSAEAERLSREAAELVDRDLAQAEDLLRHALAKDIFFGPAHNNLGVVFLKQQKLYEAANEFEWAQKLMPGQPDPQVNLAIVLEKAGKLDEAIAHFNAALDVSPGYLPAIEGISLATVRAGRMEPRLVGWLGVIASRSDDPEWSNWARAQSTR